MRPFIPFLSLMATLSLPVAAIAQQAQQPQQAGNTNAAQTVATCAGCHGAKGEGNAGAGFPRLAGQPQAYLAHQLKSYADGSRNNPIMMPIAKGLSAEQIQAVATYYAGLAAPGAKTAAPSAQVQKRGAQLADVGDDKLGVQGCVNCHGPGGSGEPPAYPYLAGQHASYLTAALGEWKSGARKTDPSLQMSMIAKKLSDSDIAALASYYAAQPAPPPETERGNVAAGTTARPAAQGSSGPAAGGTAAGSKGVGTEQGEPTSGSQQGPGGGGGGSGSGPSGSKTGEGK